jgi:hypothetical protein
MRDFTAEVQPHHFNPVEPEAVGRQVQQHQTPHRGVDNHFNVTVNVGAGIVLGDVNGASRVPGDQSLQQFGHFPPAFVSSEQHHHFSGIVVDCAQPVALARLARRGNHDLLALRAPDGAQGRHPAEIESIGIAKHVARFHLGSGIFNRHFFT